MTKILVIPGSNRSGSYNVKLAAAAAHEFAQLGADVTRISLGDYPMPLYDGDLEENSGIPQNVMRFARLVAVHHGVFIASPEYNSSISPLLKNTIDWVSRIREDNGKSFKPWSGRYVALAAASPGTIGGVRGLNHLRSVLVNVGCQVISEQTLGPQAGSLFADDGSLNNERTLQSLKNTCQALFSHSGYHSLQ